MVGRPKKNTDIEEVKVKLFFNKNIMDKLLSSGNLDPIFEGQLMKYNSKSNSDWLHIEYFKKLNYYCTFL